MSFESNYSLNVKDKTKVTKNITIDVGYSVLIPVTIDANSGVLYTMTSDLSAVPTTSGSTNDEAVKLSVLLTNVSDEAVTLYVNCLRDQDVFIHSRPALVDCLRIYSITEDNNFLTAVIKQLFFMWTILSPVLYSNDNKIDVDVLRNIWLRCPYQLLPDDRLVDKHFMDEWQRRSDNKRVVLNSGEYLSQKDHEVEYLETFKISYEYDRRYDQVHLDEVVDTDTACRLSLTEGNRKLAERLIEKHRSDPRFVVESFSIWDHKVGLIKVYWNRSCIG